MSVAAERDLEEDKARDDPDTQRQNESRRTYLEHVAKKKTSLAREKQDFFRLNKPFLDLSLALMQVRVRVTVWARSSPPNCNSDIVFGYHLSFYCSSFVIIIIFRNLTRWKMQRLRLRTKHSTKLLSFHLSLSHHLSSSPLCQVGCHFGPSTRTL
jgi:hypothetical protein